MVLYEKMNNFTAISNTVCDIELVPNLVCQGSGAVGADLLSGDGLLPQTQAERETVVHCSN